MDRCDRTSMSIILLILLAACASLPAGATDQPRETQSGPNPDLLNAIIQRMEQAQLQNRAHARPYSVTRDYVLYGSDLDKIKGHVVARVNFLPPNRKSYNIAESTGGFQEKVVRRVLEHEVEVTRDPQDTWLTSRNYDFELLGEQQLNSRRCYVLKTYPRRPDKDLMKAIVWVDAELYRVLRLDGEPQKSPSFWVKDVHIVLDFGDVSGMWLQTHTQAIAHVRFAGDYKMYSRDMRYETASVVAAAPANNATTVATTAPVTADATAATAPAKSSVIASTAAAPIARVHRSRALRHTTPLLADGVLNSR